MSTTEPVSAMPEHQQAALRACLPGCGDHLLERCLLEGIHMLWHSQGAAAQLKSACCP